MGRCAERSLCVLVSCIVSDSQGITIELSHVCERSAILCGAAESKPMPMRGGGTSEAWPWTIGPLDSFIRALTAAQQAVYLQASEYGIHKNDVFEGQESA